MKIRVEPGEIEAAKLEAARKKGTGSFAVDILGAPLLKRPALSEAVARYRQALSLRPAHHQARTQLHALLATGRRYAEAVSVLREGLTLAPDEAVRFLRRMRHEARADGSSIAVQTPAYRLDILHEFDLAEDLAIAWGYDRYPRNLPGRQTIGEPLPANEFCETLRILMVGYGYQEVMSLTVASAEDGFATPARVVII